MSSAELSYSERTGICRSEETTMPRATRNSLPIDPAPEWERICVDRDTTILEASRLMRNFGVAELVVADRSTEGWNPVGTVSAQDIVARVMATELDPSVVTAGDITWLENVSAPFDNGRTHSRRLLQRKAHQYLPVFAEHGDLAGFVCFDKLKTALRPEQSG